MTLLEQSSMMHGTRTTQSPQTLLSVEIKLRRCYPASQVKHDNENSGQVYMLCHMTDVIVLHCTQSMMTTGRGGCPTMRLASSQAKRSSTGVTGSNFGSTTIHPSRLCPGGLHGASSMDPSSSSWVPAVASPTRCVNLHLPPGCMYHTLRKTCATEYHIAVHCLCQNCIRLTSVTLLRLFSSLHRSMQGSYPQNTWICEV